MWWTAGVDGRHFVAIGHDVLRRSAPKRHWRYGVSRARPIVVEDDEHVALRKRQSELFSALPADGRDRRLSGIHVTARQRKLTSVRSQRRGALGQQEAGLPGAILHFNEHDADGSLSQRAGVTERAPHEAGA
jgi:hypothetical protein